MVKLEQIEVGAWYQRLGAEVFQIIEKDDDTETIEVMYFDGSLEEMEFDAWARHEISNAAEPEDWLGSMDMDREDFVMELDDPELREWDAVSSLDQFDAQYSELY